MDVNNVIPFSEAFESVMTSLGFKQVRRGNMQVKGRELTHSGISAIVGIVGELKGNIVYAMSADSAMKIASVMMMGMPVTALDSMSKSAISELANMLTANAATLFSGAGVLIDISTPTLMHGNNMSIQMSSNQVLCIQLLADGIPVDLNLAFEN